MGESTNLTRDFASRCQATSVENGNIVIITCSNCKTPLAEIWRTRPTVPVQTKIVAKCGLCGDKSFMQVVDGGFHYASIENGKVHIINTETGEAVDDNGTIVMPLTLITEKN